MADPTKIRGFRNVSTTTQARFLSDDGRVEIRQGRGGRWSVFPLGGTAFEVRGREAAIRAAGREGEGVEVGSVRQSAFEADWEEVYRALQDARAYVTDFDRDGRKAEALYKRLARASRLMQPWSTDGTVEQSKKAVDALRETTSLLSDKIGPASRREFPEQGGRGGGGGSETGMTKGQIERDVKRVVGGGLAMPAGGYDPGYVGFPQKAKKKRQTRSAPRRVAYRLQLTPGEVRAVEMARGRYSWPDMLATHASEGGLVSFTEPEMWQWTDDVDSDAEGGHSPFPMASGELAEKLQRFYDEMV